MKTLLIAAAIALAIPFSASADVIAKAKTEAGGGLFLFEEQGNCQKGSRLAVITAPPDNYLRGCWKMLTESTLTIRFSEGTEMTYETSAFLVRSDRDGQKPTAGPHPLPETRTRKNI